MSSLDKVGPDSAGPSSNPEANSGDCSNYCGFLNFEIAGGRSLAAEGGAARGLALSLPDGVFRWRRCESTDAMFTRRQRWLSGAGSRSLRPVQTSWPNSWTGDLKI